MLFSFSFFQFFILGVSGSGLALSRKDGGGLMQIGGAEPFAFIQWSRPPRSITLLQFEKLISPASRC